MQRRIRNDVRPHAPRCRRFLVAAVVGVAVFGVVASRSVKIVKIEINGALLIIEAARMQAPSTIPLVQRDESGHFIRRPW